MGSPFTDTYLFEGSFVSHPSSFRKLYKIYDLFKEGKEKKILLDLSEVDWIDANLCAVIDAIIYVLGKENGHQFFVDSNHIKNRFEIFERNGFLKRSDNEKLIIDNSNTTVLMTRFSCESDGAFYQYIGESLFENRAFEKMSEIKAELIGHFLEVFSNIQTHAKSTGPVFACGQYYPKKKILKFTLVDLGIGFYDPISEFTKGKIQTVEDAILWALEENHSTKVDAPGGLGLSSLKKYCLNNGHIFQIVTNGICWTNGTGQLNYWPMGKFPGTTINLEFTCK